jgi:hypothetical protein
LDASEIITAVVAAYAAIVSTLALVFQRRDKRERETTRCTVEVGLYETPDSGDAKLEGVQVELINLSAHPVRWAGLAFHKQGGPPDAWLVPTGYLFAPHLPLVVEPRDAKGVMLDRSKLEPDMDWSWPVLVQAWLATGEQFYSDEKPLRGAS